MLVVGTDLKEIPSKRSVPTINPTISGLWIATCTTVQHAVRDIRNPYRLSIVDCRLAVPAGFGLGGERGKEGL